MNQDREFPHRALPPVSLLDSVIRIDRFNGIGAATVYLQKAHSDSAISVVTRAEVLVGFPSEMEARPAMALPLVLTHPGPDLDPARSLEEARAAAGGLPVSLARPGKVFQIARREE